MSDTPLLKLPLLETAQAQKHVTHNEALLLLDAAVHLSVASRTAASPPPDVVEGTRHLVAASPSGAWAGQAGKLALAQGGGFVFLTPRTGWRLWVEDERKFLLFDGEEWIDLQAGSGGISAVSNSPRLGINAAADDVNRLAVASSAVLFTHEGNGLQLKLNKNAAADTASLLYQTGWSGRAEMGLAGDDDFLIKVSANGSLWRDAMVINRATGLVSMPNTPPPSGAGLLFNQSLADQGPGFAVDSYLAGSAIAIPAAALKAGTRYRVIFDVRKTAAGAAAPQITLRFGTAGTVADAALCVMTFPVQTAAADDGRFSLEVTFRSVGAGTAVVQSVAALTHTLLSSGLANSPGPVRRATSAPFNSTLAGAVIGVSVNGGALAAWTVSLVQASLENIA
jgi:hypothetical protein